VFPVDFNTNDIVEELLVGLLPAHLVQILLTIRAHDVDVLLVLDGQVECPALK
jgi:hypothetical protein